VYIPAPPAGVNTALLSFILLNCDDEVEGPEKTLQTPVPVVSVADSVAVTLPHIA
jgi:hypothetical protein